MLEFVIKTIYVPFVNVQNRIEEEIEHLVDGADIDGDGEINYNAYTKLICQKILNLKSEPLKVSEFGDFRF